MRCHGVSGPGGRHAYLGLRRPSPRAAAHTTSGSCALPTLAVGRELWRMTAPKEFIMSLLPRNRPPLPVPGAKPPAPEALKTAQVSMPRGLLAQIRPPVIDVDPSTGMARFGPVKLRHFISKLRRLNLTKADREVAALKDQFRREDRELLAQGRGDEIAARNRRLMGIREGAKGKLVGFNGVRFE